MAKKVSAVIKLQVPAGKRLRAAEIGPALRAAYGVNIMGFCKEFNEKRLNRQDLLYL